MKIFLDTSSLLKLYHQEIGTESIEKIFLENKIEIIFLSELTKIEVSSAIWKKVRTQELSLEDATNLREAIEIDFKKFLFVPVESSLLETANQLLQKYGPYGLRALDSIQLAAAVTLKGRTDLFITNDQLLKTFFVSEGLKVLE